MNNDKQTRIIVVMYDGTSLTREAIATIGSLLEQTCDACVAHVLEYNSKEIADIMLTTIAEPLNVGSVVATPAIKLPTPKARANKYNEEELAVIYIANSIRCVLKESSEFGVFSATMIRFAKFNDDRDEDGREKFVTALRILATKEILNISESLMRKYNLDLAKIDGLKKAYQTMISAGIIPLLYGTNLER